MLSSGLRSSQDASDVVADRCFGPHIFARFLGAISVAKTPALRWVVSSRKIPEALLEAHNAGRHVRCEDVDCARMGAGPAEGGDRRQIGDTFGLRSGDLQGVLVQKSEGSFSPCLRFIIFTVWF